MSKPFLKSDGRPFVRPGDVHLVVSRNAESLKAFNHQGAELFHCQARAVGQHPDWHRTGGDTPPGVYYVGVLYDTHGETPYGNYCLDLVDLTGNEDNNGRAGISLHGGGSGLPDPFAGHQGWVNTHGCVRVQNADLEYRIVPLVKTTKAGGFTVYLTVGP